jgi:hypothetical protein
MFLDDFGFLWNRRFSVDETFGHFKNTGELAKSSRPPTFFAGSRAAGNCSHKCAVRRFRMRLFAAG